MTRPLIKKRGASQRSVAQGGRGKAVRAWAIIERRHDLARDAHLYEEIDVRIGKRPKGLIFYKAVPILITEVVSVPREKRGGAKK